MIRSSKDYAVPVTNLQMGSATYYLIKLVYTNAFHRLCNNMEGIRFLDRVKRTPITNPRKMSSSILCTLKCARANTTELTIMVHHTGMYLVREGRRKPRNTISSQTGAHIVTTMA
ncbi:hypothetical protein MLD38_018631 [Melastoma candidum]|uniref:Uncharacterized protein n=1 Tax=Melastoma candidum TaxID=119954 RepID=A0ACB9QXY2_9MYRT|nr:hypothetical protein MLD38_018631 [Melastoma candidum]